MNNTRFIVRDAENETFQLENGEYVTYPREWGMTEEDVFWDNDEDFNDWIWSDD